MEEWKEYKLKDVTTILGDGLHGTPNYDENGSIFFINGNNLIDGKIEIRNSTKRVSENEANKYRKNLNSRTILVSINGTIGNVAKYRGEACILGKSACYFNVAEDFDLNFIYYVVASKQFKNAITHLATGTTIKNVSLETMRNYSFIAPSIYEQKRIANILSSLDDKIELNRRINENLEQQAQALFKSWFVDFEPFKDGKFVDSELGMIPEGWKVKKLGELCDSISVTHPCKEGQLIFLNTGDIENGFVLNHKYMNIKDMPGQAKKSIQENDILYSEIRPINRHFAFVNFPAQEYIVSTKLMVLRANDNESSIRLYQYLTSEDVINELQHEAESRSGTFPQIRFENIKSLKILIGSDDVEKKYTKYIGNIYKMIFQYRKEIMRLAQLRDTLLPRLMSGELAITDVDDRSIFQ